MFRDETDTGCWAAPKCLECPLALCVLDDPRGIASIRKDIRNAALMDRHDAGATRLELMQEFHLSNRQLARVFRHVRMTTKVRVFPV